MLRMIKITGGLIFFSLLVIFAIRLNSNPATTVPTNRIYPVELKGYVLTNDQIASAGNFYTANSNFDPKQMTYNQLKNKKTFLVVLAQNTGERAVCGVLSLTLDSTQLEIPVIDLPANMDQWQVWIIPTGDQPLGEGDELPQINLSWKEFDVK